MKYKVLISAPYLQPFIERFRPFFDENNIEIPFPYLTVTFKDGVPLVNGSTGKEAKDE